MDDPCAAAHASWPPVDRGDACDAPEGAYASARDRGCGYYRCRGGNWEDPYDDAGCSVNVLPITDAVDYCSSYCVADLDPFSDGLDEACAFVAIRLENLEDFDLARCEVVDGSWRIPEGATYCIGVTSAGGEGDARLSAECADTGVNAGFVVVGDHAAALPPGFTLGAVCAFEMYPVAPCPLDLFSAPAWEPDECTSG